MTLNRDIAPTVLLHHYRHNQSLHEKVVLLSVLTENVPDIPATERVRATELTHGFIKIVARYGYMEAPDIKEVLEHAEGAGLHIDHSRLSYFLGREAIKTTGTARMLLWRKRLFVFMSRNARTPTEFFNLPPDKVVELGSQMSL
jgi:KUP system potassium uptake protein